MQRLNLPTKITVLRIILIPVFAALYLIPNNVCQIVGVGVFLLAALTDWLDGYLARKYNMVTDLGKFLDPVADKVLVAAALILVIFYMPDEGPQNWIRYAVVVSAVVIIARELIITCFRTIAATKRVIMAADMLGKLKTVFQLIGLMFLLPYNAVNGLSDTAGSIFIYAGISFLIIATGFTIASAINYIVRNKHVLSGGKDSE